MKSVITVLVVALVAMSASASTYIWNGSVSNVWSVAANWTPTDGGTTFPQGAGNTAIFLSSAAVSSSGLTALPSVNITGTLDITIPTGTLQSPNGTTIDGTGALITRGNIKYNQGGAANTFAGGYTVQSGKASVSGGDVIFPVGGVNVNGGMQFMADNTFAAGCPMNMLDGWINFSDTTQNNLGVLTVTGMAADWNDLRFAPDDAVTLHFANSSNAVWAGALEIDYLAGGGATPDLAVGDIFFGTDATGLTAAQLSKITFYEMDADFNNTGVTYPATILADGKIVPLVPEPLTISLLLAGGIAGLIRRR